MVRSMIKAFGIGFHKTGTSTLESALKILGYRVCAGRRDLVENLKAGDLEPFFKIMEEFDACQDNPWPIIYKELDQRFPGSKFILTERDAQGWIRSAVNHFGTDNTEMRRWIYGVGHPVGNEDVYTERYERHNREVREYFKDRPGDLLIVNWAEGDGWKEMCAFLGVEVPSKPFPHTNKGAYGLIKIPKIRRKIGKWLRKK